LIQQRAAPAEILVNDSRPAAFEDALARGAFDRATTHRHRNRADPVGYNLAVDPLGMPGIVLIVCGA
jgi:hypothetical protein